MPAAYKVGADAHKAVVTGRPSIARLRTKNPLDYDFKKQAILSPLDGIRMYPKDKRAASIINGRCFQLVEGFSEKKRPLASFASDMLEKTTFLGALPRIENYNFARAASMANFILKHAANLTFPERGITGAATTRGVELM